jgi:hypothetical protein
MDERVAIMVINAHGKYPVYIKNAQDIYNFGVYELEELVFTHTKVSYYAFAEPGKPYADYPGMSSGIVNGIVNYNPTTRNNNLKDYIVRLQLEVSQQLIDEGVIKEETGLRYAQATFGDDFFRTPLDPHRSELWTIGNKCYNKIFTSFTKKEIESKFKQDSGIYFGYNNIGIEPGTLLFSSSICNKFSLEYVKNLCEDLQLTSVYIIDLTCSPFYDVTNGRYIVDETIDLSRSILANKNVIRNTRAYNKLLHDILELADITDIQDVIVPTDLIDDKSDPPFYAEFFQDIYLQRNNNNEYPEHVIPNYVLPKIQYELAKRGINNDIINRVFVEINNGQRDPIATLREIKNGTIQLPVIQYTPGPFTMLPPPNKDSDKMEEGGGKYKSKKPTRKHKKHFRVQYKLYRASKKYKSIKSRKNKRTRKNLKK